METEFEFEIRSRIAHMKKRDFNKEENSKRENMDEKENSAPCLRDKTKSRLERLGVLYGDGEISSPIHRSEDSWAADEESGQPMSDKYSEERSRRLAALAYTINSWEDEIRNVSPKKEEKPDKINHAKPIQRGLAKTVAPNNGVHALSSPAKKKLGLDRNLINSLEMQGFKRCESEEHLVYNYASPSSKECISPKKSSEKVVKARVSPTKSDLNQPKINNNGRSPLVNKQSPQKSAVLEMAAQFENSTSSTSKPSAKKDPALMSVAEKRAVFEKANCFVPMPQAPLATPAPRPKTFRPIEPSPATKLTSPRDNQSYRADVNQAVLERFKEIEDLMHRKRQPAMMETSIDDKDGEESEKQVQMQPPPPPPPMPSNLSPKRIISNHDSSNKSLSPKRIISNHDSSNNLSPTRIKMGIRSPVRTESPPKRELPRVLSIKEKSPKKDFPYPEMKRIRVSPPKPGYLYPSLSDIETESEVPESDLDPIEEELSETERDETESEFETTQSSTSSLGQQIVRQASKTNLKRPSQMLDVSSSAPSSSSETESRILQEMDDLLDEALGEPSPKRSRDSYDSDNKTSTPNFETCSSASFEFSDAEKFQQKQYSDMRENKTPLIHTVSVYRKTQSQTVTPTIRREVRRDDGFGRKEAIVDHSTTEEEMVLDRIKKLQLETSKQLEVISQASKALNTCFTTPGFSGSATEIEAQKLLLVANARWNALNQEIDRLKIERRLKAGASEQLDQGDISLRELTLPIKSFQNHNEGSVSVLILVKCGPTVLNTEVLTIDKASTRSGRLVFDKVIALKGLYSDFTASIEVYGYSVKNNETSFDQKHRTTPNKKEKRGTTPKKNKEKNFIPIESPGGPNAVRSSAFQLWGFAVFSLREVTRKSFTLSKVPRTSPLEGTMELVINSSMKSQVEHSGFLTVYEDVSGFGAWKRRWAVLRDTSVAFWAYPDQWKEGKVALDTIDLTTVQTKDAGLAPRELCARPHTILLESVTRDTSIPESLIAKREGKTMIIMHLLSADTKEERLQWCQQFNKVLHLLRAWKVSMNP